MSVSRLHSLSATESDLLGWGRFWEWERFVADHLPQVVEGEDLTIVFQPIFELGHPTLSVGSYEALLRLELSPRIPVGMWFRLAHRHGLADRLERVAAMAALDHAVGLPAGAPLSINSSCGTAVDLFTALVELTDRQLVADIPCPSRQDETFAIGLIGDLRAMGVMVAIDDLPLANLLTMWPMIEKAGPDFVKVDVVGGLTDDPMGAVDLTDAAGRCRASGISLVAERVERVEDVVLLRELGVPLAQGYSLGPPAIADPMFRGAC